MRHFHTSDDTAWGRVVNCTLASIYSGFVSTCMSNPFDVVKTRMMEQHQGRHLYKSSFDCLSRWVLWIRSNADSEERGRCRVDQGLRSHDVSNG